MSPAAPTTRGPAASLTAVNAMDAAAFVTLLGGVFEHSPWVAAGAFAARPFASVAALHAAMVAVVQRAGRGPQLALLNAHPELAGKEAQTGTLTEDSTSEQKGAGLSALTREEMQNMTRWNGEYRAKHGFPFIIAVRQHTKDSIFGELQCRAANDPASELATCLEQVFAITRMRLDNLITA